MKSGPFGSKEIRRSHLSFLFILCAQKWKRKEVDGPEDKQRKFYSTYYIESLLALMVQEACVSPMCFPSSEANRKTWRASVSSYLLRMGV